MRELFGLFYSPWTEKARWALDHHRIPYRYRELLLIFGELTLKLRFRRFSGVTVPALIDRTQNRTVRLMDSREIASYGDKIGFGTPLFPPEHLEEIKRFNEMSERALEVGRALLMRRLREDRSARLGFLPLFLQGKYSRLFDPVARIGVSHINREFQLSGRSIADDEKDFRGNLLILREALQRSGGRYLLGNFSYADIALSAPLLFVTPPDNSLLPLTPGARLAFTREDLSQKFSDLVSWRDEIYRLHRPPRQA